VHTPVSPNAVSLLSIFVGGVAGAMFALGEYKAAIAAAVLFQISAILDCVDGDLARVMFKESVLGKWLDLAGDQVVHVAVFGGIAFGLMKTTPGSPALWLGLSAILGALLSFAVVVRGLRRPQLDRSGRLQKLINAATNRDFSVLVLFLAVCDRLDLFLWVTAVGSHVFWITALALQLGGRSAEARAQ
jgi:phosphatidylglycerophosphate synthase